MDAPGATNLLEPTGSTTKEMKAGSPASDGDVGGENNENADHARERECHLTTLDLHEIPLAVSTVGFVGVKQRGGEHLRKLVEQLEEQEDDTPRWNASLPSLWSCWEAGRNICKEKSPSESDQEVEETQELRRLSSGPRRLHCDWCEALKSSESFLYDESSMFLKKMTRANAPMLLLKRRIVVPNVFEADWGRFLSDMRLPQSSAERDGEVQQLLLPLEVVRRDDARIIGAPSKIVSLADGYLRSLQRPGISLTRAAMHIPSVWNTAVAADRLAELLVEERTTSESQPAETATCSLQSALQSLKHNKSSAISAARLKSPAVSESQSDSLSPQVLDDDQSIATPTAQPSGVASKLKVVAEDSVLSTDYILSNGFLHCNWKEPLEETHPCGVAPTENAKGSNGPLKHDQYLQQITRPALWGLMRKKLLQVDKASIRHDLDCVSLETLEATISQQFQKVNTMSLNPSAFSSVEIVEACSSLRQAAWLHTLRMVSISRSRNGDMLSTVAATILSSAKFKHVLGSTYWKELHTYLEMISGKAVSLEPTSELEDDATAYEETSTFMPVLKKQRVLPTHRESVSVRVLCSDKFLEQDELLDELCTEHQIFFIERDLPPPIDILVDEWNCICVVTEVTFQAETNTRDFIFSLARLQVQLTKCWLVIALSTPPSAEIEDLLNAFLAALVQFRIEIQVLTSFSCEETGRLVRAVVDQCADVALNDHRILPRLWFERPFLLEEESQFERFLVSTKIVNHYAAQSLLHKICMDDLFSKRYELPMRSG